MDGELVGARKTGDHRGFEHIIVMAPEEGEGIAVMANSDRAAIGFLIDIACAWSGGVPGDPMRTDCQQLMRIRNAPFAVAAVLAATALAYVGWVLTRVRAGKRRWERHLSLGGVVRIAVLVLGLVAWWTLWHTHTLFTNILGTYPATAVTVRLLVPWPTGFVWISWAVTLWFLALRLTTFAPAERPAT